MKKYTYSFAKKKPSPESIFSSILALISLLLFLIAAIVSGVFGGNGGIYLGAIGLAAIAISIYGFWVGLKSFSIPDCNYRYSKIGSVANGIFMIGWFALFLVGVV